MSSDNKVDRNGLTYFWSKVNAYIQETIEYAQQFGIKVGNSPMGTTAATITGAIKEHLNSTSAEKLYGSLSAWCFRIALRDLLRAGPIVVFGITLFFFFFAILVFSFFVNFTYSIH